MIVLSLVVLAVAGVLLVVGILQGDSGTLTLAASIGTTVLAAVLLYFGVRPRGAVPGDADTTDRPERSPALASVPAAAGSPAPPAKTAAGKTSAGTAAGAAKVPAGAATTTTATTAGTAGTAISTSAPGTTSAAGTSAAGTTGTAGGAGGHRAPDDAPAGGRTSAGSTSDGSTSAGRAPEGRAPDGRRGGAAADEAATAASDDDPPDEPAIERASLGDLARIAARDDEVVVVDGRPRYHLVTCAHLTDRESEGLPVSEAAELGFTPCARCAPVASLIAG
jgi:hypothetical protein